MSLSFTLDLEDHRVGRAEPLRCAEPVDRVLTWLAEREAKATVFVVGTLADEQPELVRTIAEAGHEIALHALHHVPIEETGEPRFLEEVRRGKAILENITGVQVLGYRAPIFSLTRRTSWAVAALTEAGFAYSSSVLPANSPLHGMPGVPRTPFRWRDGLVELPCPVVGRGRLSLPFLGGVYLRYLPLTLIEWAIRRADPNVALWTYLHPYDLDPDEPFAVLPHAGYVTSRIVHHRRRGTLDRLDRLVGTAGGLGPPLAFVAEVAAGSVLPTVEIVGE